MVSAGEWLGKVRSVTACAVQATDGGAVLARVSDCWSKRSCGPFSAQTIDRALEFHGWTRSPSCSAFLLRNSGYTDEMTSTDSSLALRRVTEIANELAAGPPNARELVRDLFVAFSEVQREYARPAPVDTASHEEVPAQLLYCPEQGGWHVGKWSRGCWCAVIAPVTLKPTHWMQPPAPPDIAAS